MPPDGQCATSDLWPIGEIVMPLRTQPPFRADHVGSLLRPPDVRQAREDYQAGTTTAAQLRAIEDAAIRRLVRLQEDIGLQGVTDGEVRRTSWHMDFFYQIAGVAKLPQKVRVPFHRGEQDLEFTADAVGIDDKVRLTKTIFGEDFGSSTRGSRSPARCTSARTTPTWSGRTRRPPRGGYRRRCPARCTATR